jgi:hypothetical protein
MEACLSCGEPLELVDLSAERASAQAEQAGPRRCRDDQIFVL